MCVCGCKPACIANCDVPGVHQSTELLLLYVIELLNEFVSSSPSDTLETTQPKNSNEKNTKKKSVMSITCWHIIFFPCLFIFLMRKKSLSVAEPLPWNSFLGCVWSQPQCNTVTPCQSCSTEQLITTLLELITTIKPPLSNRAGSRASPYIYMCVCPGGWKQWASCRFTIRVRSGQGGHMYVFLLNSWHRFNQKKKKERKASILFEGTRSGEPNRGLKKSCWASGSRPPQLINSIM